MKRPKFQSQGRGQNLVRLLKSENSRGRGANNPFAHPVMQARAAYPEDKEGKSITNNITAFE